MKLFENKKQLLLIYGLFLIWVIVVWILHYFSATPLSITLTFLLLIFLPGFSLARIFKIKFENDNLGQVILFLVLGFIFDLLLSFAVILSGLNIDQLIVIYLISLIGLFSIAFIWDFRFRQNEATLNFNFKDVFKVKNLIYLLPLSLIILILCVVSQTGGNFNGDPIYHLTIMRKAVEGQPLTAHNLSFAKSYFSIAYVFPIWHVFLALLTKITHTNIFVIWTQIPLSLSIIVFLVWYWFLKQILQKRFLIVLSFLFFLVFIFRTDAYILTRLPVPDTLNMLLFLPLALGLSLKYFFGFKNDFKLLSTISILVIFMAAIHFTQYFYFLFLMVIFGLVFVVFRFRDNDLKVIIKRLFLIVITNLIILLPFIILLEIKNKTFSTTFNNYFNLESARVGLNFSQYDLMTQISYVLLPLTLIFAKKNRVLLLVIAAFITITLTYSQTIGVFNYWLTKIFTHIFVSRLYNNLDWFFVVWAVIVGFLFLLLDRLISKFNQAIKIIINCSLLILIAIIVWLEIKFQLLTLAFQKIYFAPTNNWLSHHYLYLIILSIIVTVMILLIRNRSNINNIFEIEEPKNHISMLLLIIISIMFLVMPILGQGSSDLIQEMKNKTFISRTNDPSDKVVPVDRIGLKTIQFIKSSIPSKSVFYNDLSLSNGYYSIPLLTDQYLPKYSDRAYKDYNLIYLHFGDAFDNQKKVSCLKQGGIEYFLLTSKDSNIIRSFDQYPQYFEPVYRDKVIIYKINYTQAEEDFKLMGSNKLSCSGK